MKNFNGVGLTALFLILIGVGALGAWSVRHLLSDAPTPATEQASQYRKFVQEIGADEIAIRNELNHLVATTSANVPEADREKMNHLTRECLDVNSLLEINLARSFVESVVQNHPAPFHFVAMDKRAALIELVGEKPTADQVIQLRNKLERFNSAFEPIRQPPEWQITIDGEKPEMPYLDLLHYAHDFIPNSKFPTLVRDPKVPAFSAADAELAAQLLIFFNSNAAKAAFPASKYPKLYVNGKMAPIPVAIATYRDEINKAVELEKKILYPSDPPAAQAKEAVGEIYARLEQLLDAIAAFR